MSETSETGKCAACGGEYSHYGNNPEPLGPNENRVCDVCNSRFVIPARLGMFNAAAMVALTDLCTGEQEISLPVASEDPQ